MANDAAAPESGILSIEQATAALNAPPKKEKEPAEDTRTERELDQDNETQEIEAEPAAETAVEPEEVIDPETEAEQVEPEAEAEQAEQPALEPPRFWDAKQKDRFRELPRDVQEIVLQHEEQRSATTSRAIQEAAEKRKSADGEASRLTQLSGTLDTLLPQAQATFKSRWDGVDWNKVLEEHGAEGALRLRNDFEAEKTMVQQLTAAKTHADAEKTKRHVADRLVKLQTTCPELVDAKDGPTRQLELVQYLSGQGVPSKVIIEAASDVELAIAYKAMRWDQAQAAASKLAKETKQPKPAPAVRPAVKPSAAPVQRPPQNARLQTLQRKGRLTIDEAVELENIRGT